MLISTLFYIQNACCCLMVVAYILKVRSMREAIRIDRESFMRDLKSLNEQNKALSHDNAKLTGESDGYRRSCLNLQSSNDALEVELNERNREIQSLVKQRNKWRSDYHQVNNQLKAIRASFDQVLSAPEEVPF